MSTKIRLARHGRKGRPFYHVVIADSRAPRDGRYIEKIGTYNPNTNPATIDLKFDRALYWLMTGAQPTDTASRILSYKGVLLKKHLLEGVKKGAFDEAAAEAKFEAWMKEKEAKIQAKIQKLAQAGDAAAKAALEAEAKVRAAKEEIIAKKKAELAAAEAAKKAEEEAAAAPEEAAAELHRLPKLLLLNNFLVMITREDCFKVGEVAKTHNLQGEVVITTDSDLLEKYADEPVFLLLDGAPVPFFIADEGLTVRNHTSYIVKFDYVDTLAQAGRLVGCEVLFEKELLEGQEPEESGYDIFELIGFEVKDQVSEETGEVADVADYSGNVVLTVSIMNKEILLPLSENYICEIDFEHSRLLVQIPRELVELN